MFMFTSGVAGSSRPDPHCLIQRQRRRSQRELQRGPDAWAGDAQRDSTKKKEAAN
jgi:hypothetical protein